MGKYIILNQDGEPSIIDTQNTPIVFGGTLVYTQDYGYNELLEYTEGLDDYSDAKI